MKQFSKDKNIPIRSFTADETKNASGLNGPAAIGDDIDVIIDMFNPDAEIPVVNEAGETENVPGGISEKNLQDGAVSYVKLSVALKELINGKFSQEAFLKFSKQLEVSLGKKLDIDKIPEEVHIGTSVPISSTFKMWFYPEASDYSGIDFVGVEIPQYHYEEAYRVSELINEKIKNSDHEFLVFGAISDNHVSIGNKEEELSKASIRHAAFALDFVGTSVGCDFIVNLGDNSWENSIDYYNGYSAGAYVCHAIAKAFKNHPGFRLVGNHDQTNEITRQWELIGQYNQFEGVEGAYTKERCFGYKDFPEKKVRVICLNTSDYYNGTGGYGVSYEQKVFLISTLDLYQTYEQEDLSNWKILILSHFPLDFYSADYNVTADIMAILQAYEKGDKLTLSYNPTWAAVHDDTIEVDGDVLIEYNFSGINDPQIIGNIHGHIHNDCCGTLGYNASDGTSVETGIVRISTPNTCFYLGKDESYPTNGDYSAELIKKEANTTKDTSVTFYVVDMTENKVFSYAYGAGNDREIEYALSCTVSYQLTNCSCSVNRKTVTKGKTFSAIITADEGTVLTECTVSMGDTVLSFADGNIEITDITDDIIITAMAEAVDENFYGITYSLFGCSSSETGKTVEKGTAFSTVITGDDGVILAKCTVKMGDVTTEYADGIISIPEVTGNLVISATTNWFDSKDENFIDGARLSSSGGTDEGKNAFVSGFIPVVYGDVIRVRCPGGDYVTPDETNVGSQVRCICTYMSDYSLVGEYYSGELKDESFDTDGAGFCYVVTDTNVAYIRVSGHPEGNYSGFTVMLSRENG